MPYFYLTNLEYRSLVNSVYISIGTGLLSSSLGVILALAFSLFQVPFKKVFSWLFLIPLLIPPYLHAFAWMHLLMSLGDLRLFGLTPTTGADLLSSLPGTVGVLTLAYFPISFFVLQTAVKNLPGQQISAGLLLFPPKKAVSGIILPMLFPAVASAFLLTFIIAFTTFDVPAFLGINVFVTQIFKSFTFSSEVGRAVYLSFLPVLIVGVVWIVLTFFFGNGPFLCRERNRKNRTFF